MTMGFQLVKSTYVTAPLSPTEYENIQDALDDMVERHLYVIWL